MQYIVSNHSEPGGIDGDRQAFENILQYDIDLNIGGHGSSFRNTKAVYEESLEKIKHSRKILEKCFKNQDLNAAFVPPHMPSWELI